MADDNADEVWTSKGYKQFLDITSVKGSSASYSTKPKRDALLFREALLRGLLFPFFPRWWRRGGRPEESQRRWALGSALFVPYVALLAAHHARGGGGGGGAHADSDGFVEAHLPLVIWLGVATGYARACSAPRAARAARRAAVRPDRHRRRDARVARRAKRDDDDDVLLAEPDDEDDDDEHERARPTVSLPTGCRPCRRDGGGGGARGGRGRAGCAGRAAAGCPGAGVASRRARRDPRAGARRRAAPPSARARRRPIPRPTTCRLARGRARQRAHDDVRARAVRGDARALRFTRVCSSRSRSHTGGTHAARGA